MSASAVQWTGPSWQKWVNMLIKQRYAEKYHIIPDKDRGDGGLEGFTACGKAYQCYAPETSIMAKWKDDVQAKMNDDLKKLRSNEVKLGKMLGEVIIKSWHLVVPENRSKDLIAHCNTKAKECQDWGLTILASDFMVTIETEENWPLEASALKYTHAGRIDFKIPTAAQAELLQWEAEHAETSTT